MSTKSPKIFIVTVIYQRPFSLVKKYLKNLFLLDYQNYQIILVCNYDNFHYLQKLNRLTEKYPKIILINNGKNLGFVKAANIGIKHSLNNGGDYTLLLNDDVKVKNNLVKELLPPFKDKRIGLVSPIILNRAKKIWYAGGMISRYFAYTRNFCMGQKPSQKIKSHRTEVISGCCVLIKNNLWQKVEFLDEDLFMYFDDPDLSLRAQKKGFSCYLAAKPLVIHLKKNYRLSPVEAYYFARNPFILIRKHYTGFKKITAYFGQFFIRLPRNLVRLKNREALSNYLKGIRDGLRGVTG